MIQARHQTIQEMFPGIMVIGFIFDVGVMGTQLALSSRYRHIWDTPVCDLMGDYMKIFSSVKAMKTGSIFGIIMAFFAYVPASLVLSYYNAPHVGQSWDELVVNGMTHKGIPGGITIGAASVLVDIYIFILPLPTLARLHLPLAKRVQVISLFATAFIGVAASVVCLVYRIKLLWLSDATWQAGVVAIPIIIENNVAIIVGSLPAFASFLRKYVAGSSVYHSIRAVMVSSNLYSPKVWQQKKTQDTFGSPKRARKTSSYYELSEFTVRPGAGVSLASNMEPDIAHHDGIGIKATSVNKQSEIV
ncbi:hypothetical protein BU24DRAFT_473473 [Aaosphaeria arxii CBS 175.79]|uniref:Rhodopsin domain-containing protein n=1 Tax=Aaosphaeria arxii CBS 175.79 TaxID=1450172 RepID=A0A6A5X8W3_9PLEO|nr:uncharacterized protein BU24DRAFT_473473 [Aaosphaeria arxii CBS 175.79]KAF2009350.1 hypothetical protein BU24DRAFT_473473 [Aaosphaeria arxii CBS 175.79]